MNEQQLRDAIAYHEGQLGQYTDFSSNWNRTQYNAHMGEIRKLQTQLAAKQREGAEQKSYETQDWLDKYLKGVPKYTATATPFEQQIQDIIGARARGEQKLTPEQVSQWYAIMNEIYKPQEEEAFKKIGERYTSMGRYYSGGAAGRTGAEADILRELASEKVKQSLGLAEKGQQQVETALGMGLQRGGQLESQRQAQYQSQYAPYMAGLQAKYGMKQADIDYLRKMGMQEPTAPYVQPYQPSPSPWEQILYPILTYGGMQLVGGLASKALTGKAEAVPKGYVSYKGGLYPEKD